MGGSNHIYAQLLRVGQRCGSLVHNLTPLYIYIYIILSVYVVSIIVWVHNCYVIVVLENLVNTTIWVNI